MNQNGIIVLIDFDIETLRLDNSDDEKEEMLCSDRTNSEYALSQTNINQEDVGAQGSQEVQVCSGRAEGADPGISGGTSGRNAQAGGAVHPDAEDDLRASRSAAQACAREGGHLHQQGSDRT